MERVTRFSLSSFTCETALSQSCGCCSCCSTPPPQQHDDSWMMDLNTESSSNVCHRYVLKTVDCFFAGNNEETLLYLQAHTILCNDISLHFLNLAFTCGLRNLTQPPFFLLIQTLFTQHDNTKFLRRLSLTVRVGPAQLFLFFISLADLINFEGLRQRLRE